MRATHCQQDETAARSTPPAATAEGRMRLHGDAVCASAAAAAAVLRDRGNALAVEEQCLTDNNACCYMLSQESNGRTRNQRGLAVLKIDGAGVRQAAACDAEIQPAQDSWAHTLICGMFVAEPIPVGESGEQLQGSRCGVRPPLAQRCLDVCQGCQSGHVCRQPAWGTPPKTMVTVCEVPDGGREGIRYGSPVARA
jgi:hypothetical protein